MVRTWTIGFFLIGLVGGVFAESTLADAKAGITATESAWSAIQDVRQKAQAGFVLQPWETESEGQSRRQHESDAAVAPAQAAWLSVAGRLREQRYTVGPSDLTVRWGTLDTKAGTQAVVLESPWAPLGAVNVVVPTKKALGGTAATLSFDVVPRTPGVYRIVLRRATFGTIEVPLWGLKEFTAPDGKGTSVSLFPSVEVKAGPPADIPWSGTFSVKASFLMARHHLTLEEFRELVDVPPFEEQGPGDGWELPATGMNWYHAMFLASRLSQLEGLAPVHLFAKGTTLQTANMGTYLKSDFSKNGWRLPMPEEYSYAAAGGTKSRGSVFVGSNEYLEISWNDLNSDHRLHPVETKLPNELGLYDLGGNALHWLGTTDVPTSFEHGVPVGGVSFREMGGHIDGTNVPRMTASRIFRTLFSVGQTSIGLRLVRTLEGSKK